MNLPSFKEDHISQIPALQLLINLGYTYLTPGEALEARGGRSSAVILRRILDERLRKINSIEFKGRTYPFSNANITAAVETLEQVPFDGLVRTNEKVYDLLQLGRSFEETIQGVSRSFSLRYVDWENPSNNVFHVTTEFEVERSGRKGHRRPDIVLFVNGIPLTVIECKRPDLKEAMEEAISQHIRNQKEAEIPRLFLTVQLLLAVNKNEARFGTVGTPARYWSVWREKNGSEREVEEAIRTPLSDEVKKRLFSGDYRYARAMFEALEQEGREVTEQDRVLFALCRPVRFMELSRLFIVFDKGEKKIARYQQYFAVKKTLARIRERDGDGSRRGGVIWHTQGSGKSLTMVILAKCLALAPDIPNPRLVLVTDRVDLDDQIYHTFRHCGKDPVKARTGSHLLSLLSGGKREIITTVIDKFTAGLKRRDVRVEKEGDIFVLVDESHRSQYGVSHAMMRKVLPNACYIGFTGTPLMKKEKSTANLFGGFIDIYTIDEAVADGSIVPLLYEGRHAVQEVAEKPIDTWWDRVCEPLSEYQVADLKKKHTRADKLNSAEQKIRTIAYDISHHYATTWKGTPFKGQLAAPSKVDALRYKRFMDEMALVTTEVLISGPDTREGHEAVDEPTPDTVQQFWHRMMDRFGTEKQYNRELIQAFKHGEEPEIIIVVDKLLVGFDAPRNVVLYITRSFRGHGLLQAIARVNRVFEGKDFGFILDYYGILEHLDKALVEYGALAGFEEKDVEGALTSVMEEIRTLPQRHADLWDLFKTVRRSRDEEAYEQLLYDEEIRQSFYERLSLFSRTLSIALSTARFLNETPAAVIERYKKDLAFFQKLRASVKRRYAETVDFKEYEPRIRKLLDQYVTSDEIIPITKPVSIFDREAFQSEVARVTGKAASADMIAHRTLKSIEERYAEDPVYYEKFSKLLKETIRAYRQKRLNEADYFLRAREIMENVRDRKGDDLPDTIQHNPDAKAYFGIIHRVCSGEKEVSEAQRTLSAEMALRLDEILRHHRVVDWQRKEDVRNAILNDIEDYLYELKDAGHLDLTFDQMDTIMEEVLSVARRRHAE